MKPVWLGVGVTTAIQAMASLALLALPAVAPAVAEALGVSTTWVGFYVAVCYVAAMTSSLLGGPQVQRFGSIRVSQVALSAGAIGLVLCTIPWLPAVILGALLIGAGYGPITPASSHLLARTTPAHQMSLVFSIKQTGVPAGGVLAGAIVPVLTLAIGWRGAFIAVALACAACAFAVQRFRPRLDTDLQPHRSAEKRSFLQPIRMVLGHPSLAVLAACSFLFSAIQVSVTAYLVTYLNQSIGFTLVAAGAALSVSQLAGVIGRVTWGAVADRGLGARGTLILLAVLMILGTLLTALIQPHWPVIAVWGAVALLGASAIGWNGVYLAAVARQAPPGQAGVATGGTLLFTYLGVVFGSPAFGALASATGSYRLAFVASAVVAALGLALLVWRALRVRRKEQESQSVTGA